MSARAALAGALLCACRSAAPVRVEGAAGLAGPETAVHDEARDLYLVSCMGPRTTSIDGEEAIVRIDPRDPQRVERWITPAPGVELVGPKGMVLDGDVLWVADVTRVHAFDATSGELRETLDLAPHGAVALNDVTLAPDGSLYLTDPRLIFHPDRPTEHRGEDHVFRIGTDGAVTVVARGPHLRRPNGIEWDAELQRLLIAPIEGIDLLVLDPTSGSIETLPARGGYFDGLEILDDGRVLVSSLEAGTIEVAGPAGDTLLEGLPLPGNFGVDRKRGLLLVPLIGVGRFEVHPTPGIQIP